MLCMSKMSKMVFAAFMQHCIQSYSFCYSCWRCQRCQIIWIIDQRLKIHTNMFLLITSLIFNGFSIRKKFWKLRLRVFQPYYQLLCMSKNVEDAKIIWPSTSFAATQLSKTFCGLKISWILRKLWPKMCVYSFSIFNIFNIHSITALRCIWSIFDIFDML